MPWRNQIVGRVHDHGVKVGIIAPFTDADDRGNHRTILAGDVAHHTRRGFVAVFLQPAHRHILQHRFFGPVRRGGAADAVEPGHDEIQRLTLGDGVADAQLEVLITRP
ncbi:hypothetical protein D1872_223080 [compost metagenome]